MINLDSSSPLDGASSLLRFAAPYVLILLCFVLDIVVLPGLSAVQIPFLLMVVYYWSIYRPTLTPAWLIFIAAILMDIVTMMPIGLNALILIGTQKLVIRQRRYLMGQSFIILWAGFLMVYALSQLLTVGIFAAMGNLNVTFIALGLSALISALCFPCIMMALHAAHKILPSPQTQKSIKLHRSRVS